MFKKLNKKGFTLAELLVVVAIIGVLVAVSIPIFTSQLEKAREATDIANLRAAKAVAATAYLSDENGLGSTQSGNVTLEYNAGTGTLGTNGGDACGKGTTTEGNATGTILFANPDTKDNYLPNTDAAGKKIQVTVTKDGTVTCKFVAA